MRTNTFTSVQRDRISTNSIITGPQLKTPIFVNILNVANNTGYMGDIAFDQTTLSYWGHNGAQWIPIGGGAGLVTILDTSSQTQTYALPSFTIENRFSPYTETVALATKRGSNGAVITNNGTALLTPTNSIKTFYYNPKTTSNYGYKILGDVDSFIATQPTFVDLPLGRTIIDTYYNGCAVCADGSIIAGISSTDTTGIIDIYQAPTNITTRVYVKSLVPTGSGGVFANNVDCVQYQNVAMAANGNIIVAGSPQDTSNGAASGAIWIFNNNFGGDWTQLKVVPTGITLNNLFGSFISISATSNIIAVGSGTNVTQTNGGVGGWIFSSDGFEVGRLLPTGATTQCYNPVAISASSEIIAMGGFSASANLPAVWLFERTNSGSIFEKSQILLPTTTPLVTNVQLSADGTTLACLAGQTTCSLFIYQNTGNNIWTNQFIAPSAIISQNPGNIVLSADGNICTFCDSIGDVFIFNKNNVYWDLVQSALLPTVLSSTIPIMSVSAFGTPIMINNTNNVNVDGPILLL